MGCGALERLCKRQGVPPESAWFVPWEWGQGVRGGDIRRSDTELVVRSLQGFLMRLGIWTRKEWRKKWISVVSLPTS